MTGKSRCRLVVDTTALVMRNSNDIAGSNPAIGSNYLSYMKTTPNSAVLDGL